MQTKAMVHQCLADLLWAVNSPPLSNLGPVLPRLSIDAIDQDHFGRAMETYFKTPRYHRVGRYFEQLLLYWLKHVRRVNVECHGMPLNDGNRTLGEVDFLFRDENDVRTHWEVAVKFYLYHPGRGDQFIGPNARDTFELSICV